MMNKKRLLRIGTFLSILMFLLVPLLISPAAAVVNYNAGTGTSTCGAGGALSITITMSAPLSTAPGATPPLIVNFNWNFVDRYPAPAGSGSNHMCTLTVTQTSPAGPPPVVATTGMTFIGAGTGTTSG